MIRGDSLDSLESLLAQLNCADEKAIEQAFASFEPYLRKVVRRLLSARMRAKFDSLDVVQSVYGDVLVAFRERGMQFTSVPQLRAFLIRATRNRFVDRLRQNQVAADNTQPLDATGFDDATEPRSTQPRPSETAQAGELWQQLLALCPPEHHELLRLRRMGMSMSEIAVRVGMHEGSVRRILRDLSVRLACQTPRTASESATASGDRSAR